MKASIQAIILCAYIATTYNICSAKDWERSGRNKRQPQQRDESRDDTSDASLAVQMELNPSEKQVIMEGDNLRFDCKIINQPVNSQVQWYYILRGADGTGFDNFTIIANEVATVDNNRYRVWSTPPKTYSLQIRDMTVSDTGEYCCFLYISYSETYRVSTPVEVIKKSEPTTSQATNIFSAPDPSSRLENIIEEAVENDIESELGKRLNITLIKSNREAKVLIHNATEEIKNLLNIDNSDVVHFSNDSTKMIVSRKMKGMSSQVKTVVSTLLSKMSSVDSTLAEVLTPLNKESGGSTTTSRSNVGNQRVGSVSNVGRAAANAKIPHWRALYNRYKQKQSNSEDDETPVEVVNSQETDGDDVNISNQLPTFTARYDDNEEEERERLEETYNTIDTHTPKSRGDVGGSDDNSDVRKCQYQLVINEFDPTRCPSVTGRPGTHAAAAMYYEADNSQTAEFKSRAGSAATDDQLTRIENRLMDEMVNTKMVNKTVNMHDDMLHKTEEKLEAQTGNLTKLERQVDDLRRKLGVSENEKADIERKLGEVMVNILEVNKRLDIAMKRPSGAAYSKVIGVESASETIKCDRHPNVTHFKDCADAANAGNADSGVYYIRPLYSACPIPVWCDMDTYPGGWTVVQRRQGGTVSFNRNWAEYRRGFGQVTGEHWLGNDNLFLLSNQEGYMLRVDMWDFYNSRVFAEYRNFKVDGERDGYKLTASNYSGTAGNGLKSHNRQKFSTYDRDHDMWDDYHCAYEWEGGWWFTNCWSSYINGAYHNSSSPPYDGISWREWKEEQLYRSEMKIRPVFLVASNDQSEGDDSNTADTSSQESDTDNDNLQKDQPIRMRYSSGKKLNRANRSK